MSLHGGLDTIGIVTGGVWSNTFGQSAIKNRCNLYASRGYLEDAPNIVVKIINIVMNYFRKREEG